MLSFGGGTCACAIPAHKAATAPSAAQGLAARFNLLNGLINIGSKIVFDSARLLIAIQQNLAAFTCAKIKAARIVLVLQHHARHRLTFAKGSGESSGGGVNYQTD